MPTLLSPHTRHLLFLPKLMLWHTSKKMKAKRAGYFLMNPGRIVHFDDDTNDNQQAKMNLQGRPVCWLLNAPPHSRGVIMALIKMNVSWRVARDFTMSRHKGPCIKCSSAWRISVVMKDILVSTWVSLVIIDKTTTTRRKKSEQNDWCGFRIIMCLINQASHMHSSQSLTHRLTHFFLPWYFETFHPDTSVCGIVADMSAMGQWPFQTLPL